MPSDSCPLILDFLMTNSLSPSYSTVPIVATTTFCPAATFGAPHTIGVSRPSPKSTVVICKWSESGWASQVFTSPITKPFSPPFMDSICSYPATSSPILVSIWQISSTSKSIFRYSFSQFKEIFIFQWINGCFVSAMPACSRLTVAASRFNVYRVLLLRVFIQCIFNILSMGNQALWRISSGTFTTYCSFSSASRTFSRVTFFICPQMVFG